MCCHHFVYIALYDNDKFAILNGVFSLVYIASSFFFVTLLTCCESFSLQVWFRGHVIMESEVVTEGEKYE